MPYDTLCALGGVPEWLIGAGCKLAALGLRRFESYPLQYLVGYAHIAQAVEHVLGKNGVTSSNLVVGF